MTMNVTQLPPETLFKIFLLTNSPKCAFSLIPRVCKTFAAVLSHRSIPVLANVDIISEEEEDGSNGTTVALVQSPDRAVVLPAFRKVRVVGTSATRKPHLVKADPEVLANLGQQNILQTGSSDCNASVVYVGVERAIKIHVSAIPERPETLVRYVEELLARGVSELFGHTRRPVRVLFGTVQVAGRRRNTSATVLGGFMRAMKPVNITLWVWDSDLISSLPSTAATSLCLPNMLPNGHIQARDMALLTGGRILPHSLKRLELFRPLPRQPWGLEAAAFAPLSTLSGLRELVVRSGRLIGTCEALVGAVLTLKRLRVLELPWSIDSRLGGRILKELPDLESLQFLHVSSPDFFQNLPTHPWKLQEGPTGVGATSGVKLKSLGLNFMEPDVADIAVMVEGIIRCLPELETLAIRINSRQSDNNNGTVANYDFYGTISRDFLVRWLRRLEGANRNLIEVGMELGIRMWGSRKSYADELVLAFANSRMRVKMCSPMGRIG